MFLHYLCICVCVLSEGQSTGVEYIDIIIIVIVTAYVRILQQRKIVVDGFDAPGYNYSIKVTVFLSHFMPHIMPRHRGVSLNSLSAVQRVFAAWTHYHK